MEKVFVYHIKTAERIEFAVRRLDDDAIAVMDQEAFHRNWKKEDCMIVRDSDKWGFRRLKAKTLIYVYPKSMIC